MKIERPVYMQQLIDSKVNGLRDHGVGSIIFYVENLDVGSWGVKNDV